MNYCIRLLCCALISLCTILYNSSCCNALTIDESIALAYKNNYRLLAAQQKFEASTFELKTALHSAMPSLNVNLNTSKQNKNTLQNDGSTKEQNLNYSSATFTLSHNLFHGMSTINAAERAKYYHKISALHYQSTKNSVILEVIDAYFNLFNAKETLQIEELNYKIEKLNKESVHIKFLEGEVSNVDLLHAESTKSAANARYVRAQLTYNLAVAKYKRVTGEKYNDDDVLHCEHIDNFDFPHDLESLLLLARKNDIDFKEAEYAKMISYLEYLIAIGSNTPSLDINFTATRNGGDIQDLLNSSRIIDTSAITVSLSQKFNGLSQIFDTQAAKQRMYASHHTYNETQLLLEEKTVLAWNDYLSAEANIHANKEALEAADSNLNNIQSSYASGSVTLLDMLTSKKNRLSAYKDYIQSQASYIRARYVLSHIVSDSNQDTE